MVENQHHNQSAQQEEWMVSVWTETSDLNTAAVLATQKNRYRDN